MRAPDKQRYLDAARHVERADICFCEQDFEITVAARLLGRPLPMVRPYELPVPDYVELSLRTGNDMAFLANLWELGRKNYIDPQGRKHYVDGTIKTRADLRQIKFPDLGAVEHRLEEILAGLAGTGLGLIYTPSQAPFLVTTAVGYQDYYVDLIDDPKFIHEFQKILEDYCLRELDLALRYPVDVIQVGAVLCSSAGPIFAREFAEQFEFPSLRRRVAMAKARGRIVALHVDGDVTSYLPDFIGMGIDVINPIEPCGGRQDIYELETRHGDRLALHGNIDLAGVLTYGTPEAVRRDVAEHIDRLAVGGGYICASSHNIIESVPLENFVAMRDAVHTHRFVPRGGQAA
ncbi:hypothetical protein HQ590_15590 [bacterium]|nr:hypothetical protein [bacterium]